MKGLSFKMDRTIIITSSVNASSNHTTESPIVPSGKKWEVVKFGAGSLKPGLSGGVPVCDWYILRFGSDIIRFISVRDTTIEFEINKEFTGDGVKKFSVQRYNNSDENKQMPFWVLLVEAM